MAALHAQHPPPEVRAMTNRPATIIAMIVRVPQRAPYRCRWNRHGTARERDNRGRALPVWQGCRVIAVGQAFLLNWDEPAPLDSRYFGPIPL